MKKPGKILIYLTFVLYVAALVYILFGGIRGLWDDLSIWEYAYYNTNLVPFRTIITYINAITHHTMNLDIPIKNLGGNLVLFLPMGFYLPFIFKKNRRLQNTLFHIFIMLCLVEIIQLCTKQGSFDVDDFILNMLGALIGYRIWNKINDGKI